MVVGFTITCAINACYHWSCEFEPHSDEVYSILHYVIMFVWNYWINWNHALQEWFVWDPSKKILVLSWSGKKIWSPWGLFDSVNPRLIKGNKNIELWRKYYLFCFALYDLLYPHWACLDICVIILKSSNNSPMI